MGNVRNVDILEKILHYCGNLEEVNQQCGNSLEKLRADIMYTDAASMCVYMIGQLANYLTGDFKAEYCNVSWRDIEGWSNLAAYSRDNMDHDKLWQTMTEVVPELREYCEQIISQHHILEQDALPVQEPEMTM